MKRIIALLSAASVAFSVQTPLAGTDAGIPPTLGNGYTYSIECLTELGLLRGTGESLELDRTPTRAEAITMIVRLEGGEDEVQSGDFSHPFTDVPEWADGYVGYAYENGITKGMSETKFGSDIPVSGQMYVTMVLRTLGYADGNTYYGHSFTYDTPFGLAEELGLLNAIQNGSSYYGDPASLYMSREYSCIRERIQTDFNREYMSYITFNALTCRKVDEDSDITLFEANHYGSIDIPNERLYEIFRHKQTESAHGNAVILTKPHHKVETLPFTLTVDGTEYTLEGHSLLKLSQDGSMYSRAKYDNYYYPLFSTLELLGIDYRTEADTVFTNYSKLSPNAANVTAVPGDDRDESVYRTDAYTLNFNGSDVVCKSRIVEACSTGLGTDWIGYADCFNVMYRGELYIQIDTLAAALDMETDFISHIYTSNVPVAEKTVNKNLDILISEIEGNKTEKDYIAEHPDAFEAIIALGEEALPYLKAAAKETKSESERRKMAMAAAYAIKPELYDEVYHSPDGKYSLVLRVDSFFNSAWHKDQVTSYDRADIIDTSDGAILKSVELSESGFGVFENISVEWSSDSASVTLERRNFYEIVTDVFAVTDVNG